MKPFTCQEPSNSNIFPYEAYTLKGKESFNEVGHSLLHTQKVSNFSQELCVNCVLVQFPHLLTWCLSSLKYVPPSFYNYQLDVCSNTPIEHKYDAPSSLKLHAKCMPGAVRAEYGP